MASPYHLFECFGVELEYMIVDRDTLNVAPLTDRVLHTLCGSFESEVERDTLSWSNELVLHVIEFKTNGPAASLDGLAGRFQADVTRANEILAPMNARLMPTAMHPWMDPFTETKLWPHEYNAVYESFNRIFDCRGHGWSNLQSTHVNLPFCGDEEFGRLHAAIRMILPILPALTASSPVMDGALTPQADARLEVYRSNARRVPSVSGRVIPEPVYTRRDYEEEILERIYADLSPFDPEGILRYEWANARGAIARFDRSAIEIRVLDIQECPQADVAILRLIVETLGALVDERWIDLKAQQLWTVDPIEPILLSTIRDADQAVLTDAAYLRAFGVEGAIRMTAGELWANLAGRLFETNEKDSEELAPLRVIHEHGCLSHRIRRALGAASDRARLKRVYGTLCECLAEGRMFNE